MNRARLEDFSPWGILYDQLSVELTTELARRVAKLILEFEQRHEEALDSQSLAEALELMEVFAFCLLATAAAVAEVPELAQQLPREFFCGRCGGYRDYNERLHLSAGLCAECVAAREKGSAGHVLAEAG